jgi:hypothetical protein
MNNSSLLHRVRRAILKEWPRALVREARYEDYQDLCCCIEGRFVGIEIKRSGEKTSELLRHEHRALEAAGGISLIAIDPDQIIRAIKLRLYWS